MKTSRREFIRNSTLGIGTLAALSPAGLAAEKAKKKQPSSQSFVSGNPKHHLGTVTYNLAVSPARGGDHSRAMCSATSHRATLLDFSRFAINPRE